MAIIAVETDLNSAELNDLADTLNEAWDELRRVPLGGRGHISDSCLDAARIIRQLAQRAGTDA
jgi:hypothetical protein